MCKEAPHKLGYRKSDGGRLQTGVGWVCGYLTTWVVSPSCIVGGPRLIAMGISTVLLEASAFQQEAEESSTRPLSHLQSPGRPGQRVE